MKLIQFSAGIVCILLLAACNRDVTDQGGTGTSTTTSGEGTTSGAGQLQSDTPPATPSTAPPGTVENRPPSTANSPPTPDRSETTTPLQPADADNTARNQRDSSATALTPGDQGESASDIDLVARVRRTVTQNDQLSTTAKNIKIIANNGKITVRGPVNSDAEKQQIEEAIKNIQGVAEVDSQLEVKATP